MKNRVFRNDSDGVQKVWLAFQVVDRVAIQVDELRKIQARFAQQ